MYLLQASVGHTHLPTLQALTEHWGGTITQRKRRLPHHKEQWGWKLHGSSLVRFLQDVFPYLREKQEQVEIALQFAAEKTTSRNRLTEEELALREGYYLALREAKR